MSDKHYLAYHTPSRMTYGGSAVDVHVLHTSKAAEARAAARTGATVWLLGREDSDPRIFWYGWLKAQTWKAAHFPELNFDGELHGDPHDSCLRPLDGGEPVLLEGKLWLPAAMKLLGNGAFGLQALHDTEVIAGLEMLRRTTPRMVTGPPRARRKKL